MVFFGPTVAGIMENEPFEDVFPIEHGDFPASYVRTYRRVPFSKGPLAVFISPRLFYIKDYTTQLYRGLFHKPLTCSDPGTLTNQDSMVNVSQGFCVYHYSLLQVMYPIKHPLYIYIYKVY